MPDWNPQANEIFLNALEIAAPTERHAYLDRACADEAALRQAVVNLLQAHAEAGSLLERPPPAADLTLDEVTPPLPSRAADRPGTRIGAYKLLEQIGAGGMGIVYMAEQQVPIRRLVALKIIKPGMDSGQVLARFEAERQALALMDHPNIARVLDAGATADGRPFFVMELVKGTPITKFCDERRLSARERLALFVTVCQAIQHAHQKGIIHRDIKPSNVLVALYDDKPVAKVIDFGVAKAAGQPLTEMTLHTGFGAIVGTPEYMSPEQATFNQLDIDTRSDIYSLGVLLYELLTGTTPVDRARLHEAALLEVLRVVREDEPPRPSVRLSTSQARAGIAATRSSGADQLTQLLRGELDWIVMKSLEKDRNRRYETATGLARDVERYLKDELVEARPPSARYRLGKFARKHKKALLTVLNFIVMLLATTVVSIWQWSVASNNFKIANNNAAVAQQYADDRDKIFAIVNENLAIANKNAASANAMQDFLSKDLLGGAGAEGQKNPLPIDVQLRTLLDQASGKIGRRFDQQPLAEARIFALLGQTYYSMGLDDEAAKHMEKSLALYRRERGERHEATLAMMTNLGHVYSDWVGGTADFAQAESLFERTLALGSWGEADPRRLNDRASMARVYYCRGKLEAAESLLAEVLAVSRKNQGEEAATTLYALSLRAGLYEARSDYTQADSIRRKLLAIRVAQQGKDSLLALRSMEGLAGCCRRQQKLGEAESLYVKLLPEVRRVHGAGSPFLVSPLTGLARIYLEQKKVDQAEPLVREAMAVCEKTNRRNWARFNVQSLLGECLLERKNYAEAEKLLLSGYEGIEARAAGIAMPFRKDYLTKAGTRLVRLYQEQGQKDLAEKWRRKAQH